MADPDYPKWLLVMFGGSFAVMVISLVGVLIEGVTQFPEPPVFMVLAASIAMLVNMLSLYLAKRKRDG